MSTEALVSGGHQQLHAEVGEDTLAHGKALLVVTTRDTEDVTLELVAEDVGGDFIRDALIVERTAGKQIRRQYDNKITPIKMP